MIASGVCRNLRRLQPVLPRFTASPVTQARPLAALHKQTPVFRLATPLIRTFTSLTVKVATVEAPMAANGAHAADDKLVALRELMEKADGGNGVDVYIVPTEDPHMSEYAPECDQRRHFISGFTGSAGTAVITAEQALLWTDGRYFLQAEKQLGPGWTLMKAGTPDCPEIPDWLAENVAEEGRVGIDPFLHTVAGAKALKAKLEEAGRQLLPLLEGNLVDQVWGHAKPEPPTTRLRVHKIEFAGQSPADKIAAIRKDMEKAKAGALLVTALDEIAWLLNLRGGDISYNPVFVAYAIVTADQATLYVDEAKVSEEVAAHLEAAGVSVKEYDAAAEDVKALAAAGIKLWIDPAKVSFAIHQLATEAAQSGPAAGKGRKRTRSGTQSPAATGSTKVSFVERPGPIASAKAVKNEAELAGMREAHLRDAVALATTFHWLESEIAAGRTVTEVEVDEFLTGQRGAQEGFVEPSFPTIAGAGPNGAIIHYRAEPETTGTVDGNTLILIDSGGQYDCGTTDVTRTFHLGEPSEYQKMCFSRVLQGHIAIDKAIFPEGTPGLALDSFARASLWSQGLNYRHGTGHGVGAALNVHEGPHSISHRYNITYPLEQGMVVSNEPGYYEQGEFGIRIENLLTIKEMDTPHKFGGLSFFGFERLTFAPLQRKMLAFEVLSSSEVDWINSYHKEVWEKVSPRIKDEAVLAWLKENTQSLQVPQVVAA